MVSIIVICVETTEIFMCKQINSHLKTKLPTNYSLINDV